MKCLRSAGLVTALLAFVCAGCTRGTVSSGPTGAKQEDQPGAEDLLISAIHQLRPENYTIAAASDKPVNLLNSWKANTKLEFASGPDLTKLASGWLRESEAARAQAATYDLTDAVHIRDAKLTHSIAEVLAARSDEDLGKVQAVFEYVIHNLALRGPNEPEDMPLGIYQLLLVGSGTPEDRAWVMADILRQLRIDTVIVRADGSAATDPEQWLVGVLLNEKVYLFDTRIGLPIPSTSELTLTPIVPATLDQIVEHPEWLQSLALRSDLSYPIDADALKSPKIEPIVEVDFWTSRMHDLESALPAGEVCVLYDPPVDDGDRAGLQSRLKACFPKVAPEAMAPWAYPARARENPKFSPAATEVLVTFERILSLPVRVELKPDTEELMVGRPENKLLRFRTEQLLGHFEEATARYLSIRHLEIDPAQSSIPQLAFLNRMGAENAYYWTCLCKFELQEYESAIEQLSGYVKRYERNGRWTFAARALLAESLIRAGRKDEAMELLKNAPSGDPYRPSNVLQLKRLEAKSTTAGNS